MIYWYDYFSFSSLTCGNFPLLFPLQLISAIDRHRHCTEHPIKFISVRSPNVVKFKIKPGIGQLVWSSAKILELACVAIYQHCLYQVQLQSLSEHNSSAIVNRVPIPSCRLPCLWQEKRTTIFRVPQEIKYPLFLQVEKTWVFLVLFFTSHYHILFFYSVGSDSGASDSRAKRISSFFFHPFFPLALSIQQTYMQPTVVNIHFRR